MAMSTITYECFIEVDEPELDADIDEQGNEKPYGDIPVFNTLAFKHKYEIFGTEGIYRFLCFLRTLKTNGTITFTYKGVAKSGYDIICEKESASKDTMVMSLEYKESDYASSRNTI